MTASEAQQPLGFDDIKKYTRCYYRGLNGFVIDKGRHLSDADGRHLQLELDEPVSDNYDSPIIKENLVNKYLTEKRVLWIDWNDNLTPYHTSRSD